MGTAGSATDGDGFVAGRSGVVIRSDVGWGTGSVIAGIGAWIAVTGTGGTGLLGGGGAGWLRSNVCTISDGWAHAGSKTTRYVDAAPSNTAIIAMVNNDAAGSIPRRVR